MKSVIKKNLEQFFACITVILVFTIVLGGKITVEQTGKQTVEAVKYAMISLENTPNSLKLKTEDKIYFFDKTVLDSAKSFLAKNNILPLPALVELIENYFGKAENQ